MIKVEKVPFNGTVTVAEGGHLPLPPDVRDEFESEKVGPCYPGKYYVPLPTNQLGEVQIHPCTCGSFFPYSTIYGWLYIKRGSPLRGRVEEIVKSLTWGT